MNKNLVGLVKLSEYSSQVEDWKSRIPSKLWEKEFDTLGLNVENKTILDLGCGPGHFVNFLTNRKAIVTGYDREIKCLEVASKIQPGYHRLIQGDIQKINELDYSFDFIMMRYVLHHIDKNSRQNLINSLYEKLNDGGKLFIETAFQKQFEKHHDHKIYPRLTSILSQTYPKKDTLLDMLSSNNFENIKSKEIYLEWDSHNNIQDALKKSDLLIREGKGPTAWLLLSNNERIDFHNLRKKNLCNFFPDEKIPRYWYSEVIVAEKQIGYDI